MPTFEGWTLWVHVAAGTVALLAGVGALVTTKGGRRHRTAGKLFLAALAVVVATTFVLTAIDPTTFRAILSLVAVFSGYLAFSGYRSIALRRPGVSPGAVDWAATGIVVLACFGLGAWGVDRFRRGDEFGLVMITFGTIGVAFGATDLRLFSDDADGDWVVNHLQRTLGAFVATVSAVSAVTLAPILGVAAWLWPTLVGVPVIYYYSGAYGEG